MIKVFVVLLLFCLLGFVTFRFYPTLIIQIQRILQTPILRAILYRGVWRLVRFLIFRR